MHPTLALFFFGARERYLRCRNDISMLFSKRTCVSEENDGQLCVRQDSGEINMSTSLMLCTLKELTRRVMRVPTS